jgi:hypothetical protein
MDDDVRNELDDGNNTPDPGVRPVDKSRASKPKPKPSTNGRQSIPGKQFVPDLDALRGKEGVSERFTFWCGLTDNCPVNQIDVAGVGFVKTVDKVINDRASGTTNRVPQPGGLIRIDKKQFNRLCEALPRIIIRFKRQPEVRSTGNTGDPEVRAKKGHLVTIPADETVQALEKNGLPVRNYSREPGDEPAARYMYCEYREDGKRGHEAGTIEEIGIPVPDEFLAEKPKRRGRPPKKKD